MSNVGIFAASSADLECFWQSWENWGLCSGSCGHGRRSRSRYCPYHSWCSCIGSFTMSEECTPLFCPVNGGWSSWETWYTCSASCGTGIKYRIRRCDNPYPLLHGKTCSGSSLDSADCYTQPCPINGHWSLWSIWTGCNVSCNDGYQNRTRQCNHPVPAYGGKHCGEISTEIRRCSDNRQDHNQICCSPGVVAGVAVLCIFLTIVASVTVSILRKRLSGPKETNLEFNVSVNLRQAQVPKPSSTLPTDELF